MRSEALRASAGSLFSEALIGLRIHHNEIGAAVFSKNLRLARAGALSGNSGIVFFKTCGGINLHLELSTRRTPWWRFIFNSCVSERFIAALSLP